VTDRPRGNGSSAPNTNPPTADDTPPSPDRTSASPGVALVTGAASGIGRALALECARHGHGLLLVDVDEAGLDAVAGEVGDALEATVAVDLTDDYSLDAIDDALETCDRPLEILMNNAGVPVYGPFAETAIEDERRLLRLNVEALTALTDHCLPGMLERGHGRILHTASLAGVVPVPDAAVYGASKAYVHSFSLALAAELEGTGITVTALCPGETETGFMTRGGMGDSAFEETALMDPATVARAAYGGTVAGKRVVVPGWRNRLRYHVARQLPSRLSMAVTRRLWSGR